jgi:N-methylhydantoinase B
MGDLRAQLAACHGVDVALRRLVEQQGLTNVIASMEHLIDYTERLTRAALAELPEGEFSFEDVIDDDGIDYGRPIRLAVSLRLRDGRLTADWSGSSPQVRGAINNTLSYTRAAVYTAVKSVLHGDIPNNEGFFRCVEVSAPAGSIANALPPAACAARGLTGFRMLDTCFGALAQMVPERVIAASEGGATGISIGGYDQQRQPFIYVDFICSAWGGRPQADGIEGASNLLSNLAVQSVEMCEREQPLEILRFEFIQDAGGAGQHRGGNSVRRDYRFLEAEGILQVRADRIVHRPYGLAGGRAGRAGRNLMQPATTAEEELPGKFLRRLHRGDVFRHEQAGPGGWGDPLRREPAAVARDLRNEMISPATAEEIYGVVIDPITGQPLPAATAQRRAALRARSVPPA